MKTIKVFIYSYKNKNLLDQLQDIINKQSNNFNVVYYIYDQNNVNRDFLFSKIKSNIVYTHINWDDIKSITYHRNMVILNSDPSDFYFEINPNLSLMHDWDLLLTSNIDDKKIISGFGMPKLFIDKFYVIKRIEESLEIQQSNYIDIDLIFCSQKDAINLIKLKCLKDIGQDLFASIIFINDNYKIYSLPSSFYKKTIQENINTYKAFSYNHGYNNMLKDINKLNNEKFESFHSILIKDIQEIPYQKDDVYYNSYKISLEQMEHPRFLTGYNGVQII